MCLLKLFSCIKASSNDHNFALSLYLKGKETVPFPFICVSQVPKRNSFLKKVTEKAVMPLSSFTADGNWPTVTLYCYSALFISHVSILLFKDNFQSLKIAFSNSSLSKSPQRIKAKHTFLNLITMDHLVLTK